MIQKLIFGLVALAIFTSCATSGKHRNGKIQKGKPIPCPQKDC